MPPLRRPVCGSGPHKWSKDTKEGRLRMHRILIKSEAQQTSSSSFRPSSAKECRVRFVFFPRNVTQHNRRVEAELRFSNAEKGGRIRRRRWSSRFCGVGVELEISSRVRWRCSLSRPSESECAAAAEGRPDFKHNWTLENANGRKTSVVHNDDDDGGKIWNYFSISTGDGAKRTTILRFDAHSVQRYISRVSIWKFHLDKCV